jgi:SHAQKYF class myb-like DNA-binding protein
MQDKKMNTKLPGLRKSKIKLNPEIFANNRQEPGVKPQKVNEKKVNLSLNTKKIFGLIRESCLPAQVETKSKHIEVINTQPPKLLKKRRREGNFNTGRWLPDEHRRFIEALLKFGNEWKSVQRYVGTRSSTQARSHAQKFFVKIGKTKIENLSLDFANNSLKSLNDLANNLDDEQMNNAISMLNQLAYDKKEKSKFSGSSGNRFKNFDDDDFMYQGSLSNITLPTFNDELVVQNKR